MPPTGTSGLPAQISSSVCVPLSAQADLSEFVVASSTGHARHLPALRCRYALRPADRPQRGELATMHRSARQQQGPTAPAGQSRSQ